MLLDYSAAQVIASRARQEFEAVIRKEVKIPQKGKITPIDIVGYCARGSAILFALLRKEG